MAITPLTVTIDLNPSYKKIPAVYVSQLDNNLRELAITLQDGGVNYDVASSGYDVYIEGTKPDYKGFSYDVTDIGGTIVGSVITVPMQTQMTCVKGMVSTEIVLKSGSDRIGSANFLLVVERAGLDEDTDVSETDIPGYIDGAQRAAEAAAQSAEDAEDAKDTAVEAAETAQGVLESIPEDYSDLSNDVDDLKNAFEQLPTSIQPDMSVGNVFSDDSYTEDKTPYLYRVSGGGVEVGKVEADTIVGGSVAWNQLVQNGNFETDTNWSNESETTHSISNNVMTISTTTNNNGVRQNGFSATLNHKYLVTMDAKSDTASRIVFGTTANYGAFVEGVMSSAWATFSTIKNCIATNNSIPMCIFGRNTTLTNAQVRNVMLIDLTQMFGSAVADYLYSLETATAGAGVEVFRKMFPNDYYEYNAGELMHVSGVSEHKTVGKNLLPSISASETKNGITATLRPDGSIWFHGQASANAVWDLARNVLILPSGTYYSNITANNVTVTVFKLVDGTATAIKNGGGLFTLTEETSVFLRLSVSNGTSVNTVVYPQIEIGSTATAYEPYEKHTYPLDSSLTLRGIPKLSDGQIYYDGDTYASDGTVTRKYGIVDLGSLNWTYDASVPRFYSTDKQNEIAKPSASVVGNIVCDKYPSTYADNIWASDLNKIVAISSAGAINVKDTAYTTAAAFKTAMSGVYLVYELATPTTEEAQPFTEYQKVSKYGTEEYVSTSIVPVGHVTKYPTDIVAKVDGLPSDFSTLIAPTEKGFTATRAYSVNQFMIINNQLYKATASIANGATITVGTNVTATTIADILTSLLNA